MRISAIESRLGALEKTLVEIEPELAALECLNDSELDLVGEYVKLFKAGFPVEEIAKMMGHNSFQAAREAIEKADMAYRRLTEYKYTTS
jgi:hypothetical protein